MKFPPVICLLFFVLTVSQGCRSAQKETGVVANDLKKLSLDQKYQPEAYLETSFQTADFNGDGHPDRAVAILEKKTGKKGILVVHGNTREYFVMGAGTPFGENDDDYRWADVWRVYKDTTAYETEFDEESGDIIGGKAIKLARPALMIMAFEHGSPIAGGIIYWTGKEYIWIHQGE